MQHDIKQTMTHRKPRRLVPTIIALLISVVAGALSVSARQDCAAMPTGPARTDCYLVQARIARENANIAGTTARVNADAARLRAVTNHQPKPRRTKHRPSR